MDNLRSVLNIVLSKIPIIAFLVNDGLKQLHYFVQNFLKQQKD